MKQFFLLFCWMILTAFPAAAQDAIIVRHYQHQERYAFGQKVLDLALQKLRQPYVIEGPDKQYANEKRGEMQIIAGQLDLQWMSTTPGREKDMIPVKIPLYRGILGLRLVLVTPETHGSLRQVRTLKDLQQFMAGHGTHWGDLPVYAENGLKVHTHARYNTLFTQLIGGKFDYFSRGLNEIWAEQARYDGKLEIAQNVMLFYPHPVYFFVGKHRAELANQIEIGLDEAISDGSYQEIFMEQFGEDIRRGQLENRRLVVLRNPVIPSGTPEIDTSWWLPAKFQSQVKSALGY